MCMIITIYTRDKQKSHLKTHMYKTKQTYPRIFNLAPRDVFIHCVVALAAKFLISIYNVNVTRESCENKSSTTVQVILRESLFADRLCYYGLHLRKHPTVTWTVLYLAVEFVNRRRLPKPK